jgi:nucleoside-diphosphate-sugar epimerase
MTESPTSLPLSIANVDELDDLLSRPSPRAIESIARLDGDLMLLGAGGKMGPTLARMARRASDAAGKSRRILGVSRFTSPDSEAWLNGHGVETIRCDLTDESQLNRLPDVPNVIFMTGMKFGATGKEPLTWMTNVFAPGMACRKFSKSRIVAFSTGNVYALTPTARGGSQESDVLRPVGEYAMTAMGRERILTHFSHTLGFRMSILRLNYAQDLRYGVLSDIARAVYEGRPIDVAMGHFNAIWQGDANAMALAAFDCVASPPQIINLAGPEILNIRAIAEEFGRLLDKTPVFVGAEAADALLSNGSLGYRLCGEPRINVETMIAWIADWIRRGGASLNKPTHFEVRDGAY